MPKPANLGLSSKAEGDRDDQKYAMCEWDWNEGLSFRDVAYLTAIKGLQDVVFFGQVAMHGQLLRPQMVN